MSEDDSKSGALDRDAPLRIIHLEDNAHDAELIHALLKEEWPKCLIEWVDDRAGFEKALKSKNADVILSDFRLQGFDGREALALARLELPHIPFILISGQTGEETAVEALKSGATDFILKDHPVRLASSMRRALKEAQDAHQIREQAALLEKAQDAIIVRDLEHRIIFWNKSAERIYGFTQQEAIGSDERELIYPKNAPHLVEAFEATLRKGEWTGELKHVTKMGKELIVEARFSLLRDGGGDPRSVLAINTNITDKKKLETQFLRAQRLESIGTLAGGIAHDLNNILAPILMAVQLLKMKSELTEDEEKLLNTIEISAQRGAGMVQQVLSFARGSEGARSVVPIRHLIADQQKIARETFPKSINVEARWTPQMWSVLGDATQLYQVLMNLCVNARDAMPNGGTIKLIGENVILDEVAAAMNIDAKPGPYAVVTISDSGTGIPADIIDKIFDPFFTTKELGKGTGLGLSTVLGIVKSHGGFTHVYSEFGRGTQFKIYIPAVVDPAAEAQSPSRLHLPDGNGKLILVADDEPIICEMTKRVLTRAGFRVITANDGTQALALFAEHKNEIALVVTDMSMPYMDGRATIRALEKMKETIKIVAVSGIPENERAAHDASQNVAFLAKPYTSENLLAVVSRVLET